MLQIIFQFHKITVIIPFAGTAYELDQVAKSGFTLKGCLKQQYCVAVSVPEVLKIQQFPFSV